MKLCRCPICHSDIHLEGLIEDEAGRELLVQIITAHARSRQADGRLFRTVQATKKQP